MNIRLEYSPLEGRFNQEQATDKTEVAKGYRTLCCFFLAEKANRFIEAMQFKYPELMDHSKPYPLFAAMKEELYFFLAEDTGLLEEHMYKTYKRRSELVTKNKRY